jgi:type II secretory pathway component PulF
MFATLTVHYVALAAVLFVLGGVIPGYQQGFERLGVEVPRITLAVFQLSDFVSEHWYTLILAAVIFDPPIVGFLTYSPTLGRWLSGLWNTIILLGTVLILFFALVAVYLPFRGLT